MEISAQNTNMSDDEDDLESLRLAALQTIIKKPVINSIPQQQQPPPSAHNKARRSPPHRARPHFSGPGRGGRGAHFNGRTRNTNLISVPVVQTGRNDLELNHKNNLLPAPKLKLPQDRYCNKNQEKEQQGDKSNEVCSKFNRYDHSDESDSEEESEPETSGGEEGGKLQRSDSLEALMEELEYEISGGKTTKDADKAKETAKVKKQKDKRRISESEIKMESEVTSESKVKTESEVKSESTIKTESEVKSRSTVMTESEVKSESTIKSESEVKSGEESEIIKITLPTKDKLVVEEDKIGGDKILLEEKKILEQGGKDKQLPPRRRRSPLLNGPRRHNNNRNYHRPHQNGFVSNYPEPQQNFNYTYHPPPINHYNQPPPSYPPTNHFLLHRPLSPLNLNTDVLSTIAMAPLSPRSAAFVLQNREIIERRKKSPRRSYSRSPSPSYTYRRPASPSYRSPSRSPPYSPPRRAARNPSPLRPARSNRKTPPMPKASVKERLGVGRSEKIEEKRKEKSDDDKEKQDEPLVKGRNSKIEDEPGVKVRLGKTEEPATLIKAIDGLETDPAVLEARKRKFEENTEVTAKEGIIRLKPKSENERTNITSEEDEEKEDLEDDLLDLDVNETIVDNLLSDDEEESDDENEGRFKLQSSTARQKPTVIPFTQLSSNKDRNITTLALGEKLRNNRRERECSRRRRKRSLSQSPRGRNSKVRRSDEGKIGLRSRAGVKREHSKGRGVVSTRSCSPEKLNVAKSESAVRKVAIAKSTKENDDLGQSVVPEVIVDDEENDVTVKKDAGDLRAQLSRKRAERQQHKHPITAEDVQSRLLQNALEGAVFKNSRKLNTEKEAAPKDKLPIHMRLGLAKEPDKCKESKRRKKKSRNSEQV